MRNLLLTRQAAVSHVQGNTELANPTPPVTVRDMSQVTALNMPFLGSDDRVPVVL